MFLALAFWAGIATRAPIALLGPYSKRRVRPCRRGRRDHAFRPAALFQPLGEKQHVSVGDAMFARDGQIRKGRPPVPYYGPHARGRGGSLNRQYHDYRMAWATHAPFISDIEPLDHVAVKAAPSSMTNIDSNRNSRQAELVPRARLRAFFVRLYLAIVSAPVAFPDYGQPTPQRQRRRESARQEDHRHSLHGTLHLGA